MIRVSQKIIISLCVIGVLINFIHLRNTEMSVILWHTVQYMIVAIIINPLWNQNCCIFGGIILMLFVDAWLMVEVFLGTQSDLLMLFSVLSAFKILGLFLLGAFIGYYLSLKRIILC